MNKFFLLICLINISNTFSKNCFAQSPYYSESLIKYDLLTHKTDKPIPFDRSFTLVIEKLSSKNVVAVHAYEAEFIKGNRQLVKNKYIDCNGNTAETAIKDIVLNVNPYSDTLQIFFPPLKPNIDFDINVIYGISKDCKETLMKLNAQLSTAAASANTTFNQFLNCTIDKITNRTYTNINFAQYQVFYSNFLASNYNNISNVANFTSSGSLTEIQTQAIDLATSKEVSDFKDGHFLLESSKRALFGDIILGNRDISKVFLKDDEALTSLPFGNLRLQNLESNIIYFDTVLKRLDRVISKGILSVTISGTSIDLNITRNSLITIRANLQNNYSYLETELKAINNTINNDVRLKQGIYFAGNTVSSDLKSAGGNILFIDAGFANIIAPGVTNKAVYIPKLYWGVSIYFRPIDKNTRRNRFPSKFNPEFSKGCIIDPVTGIPTYGPDYGIVTKNSIWQHLSLNLGITLGSMNNKDFENFYNNNSLLIGPAYRFERAFKVSSGLALLKRSSQNPLISEKYVIPAGYISLSVDIDFIQGIKDITSILFK